MRSGSAQERTFSQIAEELTDASDAMRDKDLGEMVGAVSNFARRNPMVFVDRADRGRCLCDHCLCNDQKGHE